MDREAKYREIVEANADRIYRICCGYIRDAEERKDVFQEALMNVWRSLGGFEGRAQVSTWIYRIVVNTCLMHLRVENRQKQLLTAKIHSSGKDEPADTHGSQSPAEEESIRNPSERHPIRSTIFSSSSGARTKRSGDSSGSRPSCTVSQGFSSL